MLFWPQLRVRRARFVNKSDSCRSLYREERYELAVHQDFGETLLWQESESENEECESEEGDEAPQLVHEGDINYLVSDYLSEITMSLLTAAKHKSPNLGYAPDFIHAVMKPLIKPIKEKGIRVVSNAGGVNPHDCAKALLVVAKELNIDLKVAVVMGDDLMGDVEKLRQANIKDMDSGVEFPASIESMNAYLGAAPIAGALELGADVVVTGRCVDSALALGPLMYEFGWKSGDYDLLAAGRDNIGYPIAECAADGKFILSKPPNTGGLVSPSTVAEQLIYELGDPAKYILPDVTCDFTQVRLQGLIGYNGGAVLVQGAYGEPATEFYKGCLQAQTVNEKPCLLHLGVGYNVLELKFLESDSSVCATYTDGFRATAVCPIGGPFASLKARKTGEALLKRTRRMFEQLKLDDYTRTHIQVLGSEETYGKQAFPGVMNATPREAVLWLAVHHQQRKALELFAMEIASAGTSMAPGLTALVGGRPRVSPLLRLYSFLYPKDELKVDIFMNGEHVETMESLHAEKKQEDRDRRPRTNVTPPRIRTPKGRCTFPLSSLAFTRSGDKGNNVNIGVIARHPSYVPFISEALTEKSVEKYFSHLFPSPPEEGRCRVKRYELPGINAFNFVLEDALGGGGVTSLRSDPQGKALGQMLLDFKIKNVPDILPSIIEPNL
ncbi:hypothetical protein P5673_007744 [Acropora cervicornis]|uniref:Uncharacterized protein n=1 Tax=Acropora cervicornis TaxID=6130 RepID=A0AAD9VBH6_ACRCE|nr:hypothetical protein P5673_007744 [Acropora cervicornis]